MRVQGIFVYEAAGAVYYSKGQHKDKLANVHRCTSCQKWVEPIFKGVPGNAETYLYEECVDCGEVMCAECSCVDSKEPDETTCSDCYQTRCIRRTQ